MSTSATSSTSSDEDRRFGFMTDPTEWLEAYRPGGLHPIHLGDTLCQERYKIIRKLGYGSFSTVWLAHDRRQSTLVAIKVARADASDDHRELEMYRRLSQHSAGQYGKDHVMTLLDSFTEIGPNGDHLCMVFEPMGPSANKLVEGVPLTALEFTPYELSNTQRKSLVKQLLQGLHYLHTCEIVHADINFGNVLFAIPPLKLKNIPELQQEPVAGSVSSPVKRRDGKRDESAPKYLCLSQPLTESLDLTDEIEVKLADLEAGMLHYYLRLWALVDSSIAFPFSKPPAAADCGTPIGLRAPEIVLDCPIDHKIDIWTFGCLVFQLITGRSLFAVSSWAAPTADDPQAESNDDHLLQMIDMLGMLPPTLREKWPRLSRYFDSDLELIRSDVGSNEVALCEVSAGPDLAERFLKSRPIGMGEAEAAKVLILLRKVLRYQPSLRPSTEQLLEDDWIKSID